MYHTYYRWLYQTSTNRLHIDFFPSIWTLERLKVYNFLKRKSLVKDCTQTRHVCETIMPPPLETSEKKMQIIGIFFNSKVKNCSIIPKK